MQYGFKARFVVPIEMGTKQQTIRRLRAGRSRHARLGDLLQLNTGSRYKPRRIGLARCLGSWAVGLDFAGDRLLTASDHELSSLTVGEWTKVDLGGPTWQAPADLDRFAVRDGFADWSDLREFWRVEHDAPSLFIGVMIVWGETFAGPLDPPPADLPSPQTIS